MQSAVASVLVQDGDDWHLTVVEDCMPDPAPRRWCESIGSARLTYVRNERNLGANANFRKALGLATAERVVVMGADDVMLPGYLARMREVLARFPDAAVVQPGVTVIDGDGVPVRPVTDRVKAWARRGSAGPTARRGERLAASLLHANWTYFPSLCWHRETVQRIGFREGLDVVQDLALLLDVLLEGGVLVVDPRPTFRYRRHAASDSSVRAVSGARFREEKAYFRAMAATCAERGWSRAARAAEGHLTSRLHAAALAPRALRAGDLGTGSRLLVHALGR
jgi:glycosyltransferase involved in cell wall biosynthesis